MPDRSVSDPADANHLRTEHDGYYASAAASADPRPPGRPAGAPRVKSDAALLAPPATRPAVGIALTVLAVFMFTVMDTIGKSLTAT